MQGQHRIELNLVKVPDGESLGEQFLEYDASPLEADADPMEDGSLSLAVPLIFTLPEPGLYRVNIEMDSGEVSAATADLRATSL